MVKRYKPKRRQNLKGIIIAILGLSAGLLTAYLIQVGKW